MIKTKKIPILLVLALNISCQDSLPDYKKFQTFNEYQLKGVPGVKKDVFIDPYIYVKKNIDTIIVITSDNKDKKYLYINKGDYWYNLRTSNVPAHSKNCKEAISTIYYFEKFIYNDTILSYKYIRDFEFSDTGQVFCRYLTIETKWNYTDLIYNKRYYRFDENDKFFQLRNLARHYKDSFPYYSKKPEYQPRYYRFYNKVFRDGKLFIYENDGINGYKFGCINDVREMNGLGEFENNLKEADYIPGKSVLSDTYFEGKLCE